MKWIAISGSWRKMNKELEKDVRNTVREVISQGNGLVSGGGLNVDYVATDEAIRLNSDAGRIKIFIPSTLEIFSAHYRKRADEGVITKKQAEELIGQLNKLKKINPLSIIENRTNKTITQLAYYERNSAVIEVADELVAFHVNKSSGTKDAIDKAHRRGIPARIFTYRIE